MSDNAFVTLAVPSVTGTGAPSDISGLVVSPSLIVDGPDTSTGSIVIEISEDGSNFSPATTVFPIHNPPGRTLDGIVANFARVRRVGGGGPAFVALGGIATDENLFAPLTKNAFDTSAMGPHKTIVVAGSYPDVVVVEASNDGANFDVVATFDTRDTDLKTVFGSWVSMRLAAGSDVPTSVAVGASFSGKPTGSVPDHIAELLLINDSPLDKFVVVKMHGNGQYGNSRADIEDNCFGTIGITTKHAEDGDTIPITTDGKQTVLMAGGLVDPPPRASQTVYLSPFVFGHATNVKPKSFPNRVIKLGIIKDDSLYDSEQTCVIDVNLGEDLPAGPAAGDLSFGFFFNFIIGVQTVALGAAVPFDTNGSFSGGVQRDGSSTTDFILPYTGTYEISWDVTFNEASQLMLELDSGGGFNDVPVSVSTSPGANSKNSNVVIITTTNDNSKIHVVNPTGNAGALTLTPASVGLAKNPVASLSINRIA